MKYLLDTDTLSFYMRQRPSILNRFLRVTSNKLVISSVTMMEIEYGFNRKPKQRQKYEPILKPLLEKIQFVDLSVQDGLIAGRIKVQLDSQGTPIGPYDLLIAGIAVSRGLIVVTGNTREYSRITGLRIEDWSIPE